MDRRRLVLATGVALAAIAGEGCTSVHRSESGYERRGVRLRRRRDPEETAARDRLELDGRELRFEPELGVYRVVGLPDHYYLGGWFYRPSKGAWQRARALDGAWAVIDPRSLPPGLRRPPR